VARFGGGERRLRRLARGKPRRAHEDDGVIDAVALEATPRLETPGKDSERSGFAAVQEALVSIGLHRPPGPSRRVPLRSLFLNDFIRCHAFLEQIRAGPAAAEVMSLAQVFG